MPNLTAKENVELAAEIVKDAQDEEALGAVGLGHRINNFPAQLSGGEQQRVSIRTRGCEKIQNSCFAMSQQEHSTTIPGKQVLQFYKICRVTRGNGDYRNA